MSNDNNDVSAIEKQNVESSVNNENTNTLNEEKDYKQLYENQKIRAEKGEAKAEQAQIKVKELENKLSKDGDIPINESPLSREEAILYAKGFSDDEIAYAKKVSQLNETTPLNATNDPLFKSWKENKDKEIKIKAATMDPTNRGKKIEPKKNVGDTGLSREEHKRLAMEKMQNIGK